MEEKDIQRLLDTLANYQAQETVYNLNKKEVVDGILKEKQARLDEVYTPEIRAAVAEIEAKYTGFIEDVEAEFEDKGAVVKHNIDDLQAKVKELVIAHGKSIKGTFLQAVYTKPRVTWDGSKLEGFAIAHPEILVAKKVGQASVSFRDVK